MHDTTQSSNSTRREFLKSSTAAAVGTGVLGSLANTGPVHAGGDDTIKVGIVGIGARGSGAIVNALKADSRAKLVAVGDLFADHAEAGLKNVRADEEVGSRIAVEDDHVFIGFDAYKQVIDSDVDVVLLTSLPHFRPRHIAYAVEKGKHLFVEKPIAVDAPGVQSVIDACEQAQEKGLSVVSGLCWRYDPGVNAFMERIQDGAIGDIVTIQSDYLSGQLWHRGDNPQWSRMEYQLRNWYYQTWLSGDHIVEQAIHSIDKTAWLMGDVPPIKASGMGGRQQRTDSKYGNIFDHHAIVYEYPGNVRVYLNTRQQNGCHNHVDEYVTGSKGQGEPLKHAIYGPNAWVYPDKRNKRNMYDLEHEALFASIRNGNPINNGHYMCNSTMIAIMGRMCTYTGKELTWEQAIHSQRRLGPDSYAWGDAPDLEIAVPGVTEFV
jgi:predicted dehydrogenase